MAREYCLVCFTCKEFIDLHKFNLVKAVCDLSPLGIDGSPVSQSEIKEGIEQVEIRTETNHWIHYLVPHIEIFANEHANHNLRMVDDCEPDYVGRGKPWAFYLGFSVFSFCTLISLLVLLSGLAWGMMLYIFMVIRIGGEVVLIMNLKTANSAVKHLKYKEPSFDELLDSKM